MTTSLTNSQNSNHQLPSWFWELLGDQSKKEGEAFNISSKDFFIKNSIPREKSILSKAQTQTEETFGFKWKKRDTFESDASLRRMRSWLNERYGDVSKYNWREDYGPNPIVLDAGCGAGMSGIEYFSDLLTEIKYLGVDVSEAVDVARDRFLTKGVEAAFLQADISDLPLPKESVDIIFSEGVLHHTNSTKNSLLSLAKFLKKNGTFMFYVYKKKGPVREYTDDYIRNTLQDIPPEKAWELMEPLTQLGITLGKLDIDIEIPKDIELLEIPAGKISLQRLFYWHVAKMFYHPELSFDEMNHINFDWYAPANASRHTIEEIRQWCQEANLSIQREVVEDAGITIVARKI